MKPNLITLNWGMILLCLSSCAYTPKIKAPGKQVLPESVASMEWAEIGGISGVLAGATACFIRYVIFQSIVICLMSTRLPSLFKKG